MIGPGIRCPITVPEIENVFMRSKFHFFRGLPDNVTEELVAALSNSKAYEFKSLFSVIHAALRARNVATGGEEMLRLRTYEKLQNLVERARSRKPEKKYRGVTKAMLTRASRSRGSSRPKLWLQWGCF